MKTLNLKISLLALASVVLSACGVHQGPVDGSTDLSSRDTNLTKAVAFCNIMTGPETSGLLKAFRDTNGTLRFDLTYLKLTSVASSFTNDTGYIRMYRWQAAPTGYVYLDPNPLSFYIHNPQTNSAVTGWVSTLKWSDISTAAQSLGYNNPTSFFNAMQIIVNVADAAGEYDVLQVTNYDSTTHKATSQTDALLPLFYASPAEYAFETNGMTRANVLRGLHPYANLGGQYTGAQYAQMAQSYCF